MMLETVYLTDAEFKDLPNYSGSVPTLSRGKGDNIIGVKRWRRCTDYYKQREPETTWLLGEYIEEASERIMIRWREIKTVRQEVDKLIARFEERSHG